MSNAQYINTLGCTSDLMDRFFTEMMDSLIVNMDVKL